QGRVYVFAGANGVLLRALTTPNPEDDAEFGYPVAIGNVTAGSEPEVVAGAAEEDPPGYPNEGRAYALSGQTGAVLFTLNMPVPTAEARFGNSLTIGRGHPNQPGIIAVGAPYADYLGKAQQGRAFTFASDSDGDGVPDAFDNCPATSNAGQADVDG